MRFLLLALLCLLPASVLPAVPPTTAPAPAPMLASTWRGGLAVDAFLVSEKLDGVRARWDGRRLWTRGGAPIVPPAGFTRGWPSEPMGGELWAGRDRVEEVSALVRRSGGDPRDWARVRFMLFDLPTHSGPFTQRVQYMRDLGATTRRPTLAMIEQRRIATA